MDLTIIIPAHNEEGSIIKTLEGLKKAIKVPHKTVIVNDCSTDQTEQVVNQYAKKNKNISCLQTTPKAQGFANALKKGFMAVSTGAIVPIMADLCDEPKTINIMYDKMQKGWDVVCGSRYMKGGEKTGGSLLQHYLSKFVCKSLKYVTGIPTSDVSNAFKMYRKEWLSQVKINPKSGVEASMEILFQMYFNGAKITEVPTSWIGRKVGKSKFQILHRAPRYIHIYLWALENSMRKMLGIKLKKFYV